MCRYVLLIMLSLVGLAGCADATPISQPAAQNEPVASAPTSVAPATIPATVAPTNAAIPATIAPAKPQPLSGGDARAAVIAALVAQVQGGPYRMTTVTESSGAPFEVVGEVVPPDRYHTTNVFDGITTEMIIIGDVIWRKVDDTWIESSFVEGAAGLASINSPETITAAVSDATLVGSDTLAGVPVIVYRYISTFGEGEFVVASDTTLWVDAASGLPLKIQSLSDIGGEKSTTTQTIVYDPSVTVKPPE